MEELFEVAVWPDGFVILYDEYSWEEYSWKSDDFAVELWTEEKCEEWGL